MSGYHGKHESDFLSCICKLIFHLHDVGYTTKSIFVSLKDNKKIRKFQVLIQKIILQFTLNRETKIIKK